MLSAFQLLFCPAISDAYCLLAPVLSWSAAFHSNSALHLGHSLGGQGLDEALLHLTVNSISLEAQMNLKTYDFLVLNSYQVK